MDFRSKDEQKLTKLSNEDDTVNDKDDPNKEEKMLSLPIIQTTV